MLALGIAVLIAVADQLTKFLVQKFFVLHESLTVIPGFFDLRYIQNTGAAFGRFEGGYIWLSVLSVVMLVLIVIFRKLIMGNGIFDRICLGLICGGIVGNLIDRVRLHYVVDFLDFYFKGHHFPAFNVADSSICVGVFLYAVLQYIVDKKRSRSEV
jgi:signal peptidase II